MSFYYSQEASQAQYTTSGLKANDDVSFFYDPSKGNSDLPHRVGQRPVRGVQTSSTVYAFKFKDEDVLAIGGGSDWWKPTWNDHGDGQHVYYSVWEVRSEQIPNDFVCVSPFFFKVEKGGYTAPTANEVKGLVAVSASYVNFTRGPNLDFVWKDAGDDAKENVSVYTGPDHNGHFAFPTFDPVLSNVYFPILDFTKGTVPDSESQKNKK